MLLRLAQPVLSYFPYGNALSGMLELTSGKETVRTRIEASAPVSFTSETIEVNCPPYTRIGIVMKDKARNGYIRMVMM